MVIELGPPVLESSTTMISKFNTPTDSIHQFHQAGIDNWLPTGLELWPP